MANDHANTGVICHLRKNSLILTGAGKAMSASADLIRVLQADSDYIDSGDLTAMNHDPRRNRAILCVVVDRDRAA
jgi:hypothetical protein